MYACIYMVGTCLDKIAFLFPSFSVTSCPFLYHLLPPSSIPPSLLYPSLPSSSILPSLPPLSIPPLSLPPLSLPPLSLPPSFIPPSLPPPPLPTVYMYCQYLCICAHRNRKSAQKYQMGKWLRKSQLQYSAESGSLQGKSWRDDEIYILLESNFLPIRTINFNLDVTLE